MPSPVALRVARRPLDTLGVVFQMLRAGIRPLVVAVLKYAGLPALIGGAGIGAFYGGFFVFAAQVESGGFPAFGWVEGVGLVVGFLGLYAAYTVSMLLSAAWTRRLADAEPFDADALWDEARPHLGAMLRLWLLTAAVCVLAIGALGGLAALFAQMSGVFIALMVLLAFPAAFAFIFLATPPLTMVGQVMLAEDLGARDTLRRAWELLAGVRGGSGVLLIVVSLMVSMAGYVVMLPFYGVFFLLMIWGGVDDPFASMEKMGYAMGFVVSAANLIPQLLYFIAAGALYYARIEATEYVGFSREVGSLMEAFPDGLATAPPPLSGTSFATPPPLLAAPEATSALTDETFFAWTEPPSDSPEPAAAPTDLPLPDTAPPSADRSDTAPAVPPDAFDRWRGPRTDPPAADAS